MISIEKAQELIQENILPTQKVTLRIDDLSDSVLQETLIADRDYPPFHRVAMDGIAICYDTWLKGKRKFEIERCQQAGEPAVPLRNPENCIEVMTGSVLPDGCDAVIRYEDIQSIDSGAELDDNVSIKKMQNVHHKGSDYKKGDILLEPGVVLTSPQWSVAASVGAHEVAVAKPPRVALVSTGDELVDVSTVPLGHQIRRSNSFTLLSSLRASGFSDIKLFHLRDNMKEIMKTLAQIIEDYEVVILSGGVSKGKFDFIPKALTDLKVREIFHKVRQKPGKPLWFGVTEKRHLVFGLPGNPVSALICLHRYALPVLKQSMGIHNQTKSNQVYAVLDEKVEFKKNLTYFLSVAVRASKNGTLLAKPICSNGSGDFSSLTTSSGFLELPENQDVFERGQAYPLYLWRGLS